jgi:chromosome segregation protein
VENELKEETSKLAEREGFFSRVQAEFQNLLKEIHKAEEELAYLKKKGLEIYAIASKICWERWEDERRLQTLKEELNDVKELVKEIYREIEICKKEISALLERREEMHKRISEKREEMEKNMNERASISEQKVQIETAISYIKEDIYRKYAVDIENVEVPEVIDESLKAELKEKLEELEKLGEVSMHALDEYEELSSRHSFLSSQKEDLLKAMSDIEKLIKRIREETKDMFKESFESVQEKFNELISTFMEGGKGEIKMVNPDDLFDSGIELFVQPSGKKLKHMGLLSGGEKALVALAFIFSVLSIKDVPFAFFDEIDAPLDDINIQRFVWLLRKMAENSQVIIITHNKLTMSYANALYGVSMEEPGVSKILSVQLKR